MHPAVQWPTLIMTELALSPPPAPAAPAPEPAPVIAPGPETTVFILGVEQEAILTSVLNLPWRCMGSTFCLFAFTFVFASQVFLFFLFFFYFLCLAYCYLVFTAHQRVLFIVCEFLLVVSSFSLSQVFLFSFLFFMQVSFALFACLLEWLQSYLVLFFSFF